MRLRCSRAKNAGPETPSGRRILLTADGAKGDPVRRGGAAAGFPAGRVPKDARRGREKLRTGETRHWKSPLVSVIRIGRNDDEDPGPRRRAERDRPSSTITSGASMGKGDRRTRRGKLFRRDLRKAAAAEKEEGQERSSRRDENGVRSRERTAKTKARGGGDGENGGETNRPAASALLLWENREVRRREHDPPRGSYRYAIAAYPTQWCRLFGAVTPIQPNPSTSIDASLTLVP